MGAIKNYMEHWCKKRTISDKGCWVYTGFLGTNGYGHVYYKGKAGHLSRFVLIETTGLHEGNRLLFACHKCNNKACFNPEHLYWGTRSDNANDMVKSGSHNWLAKNSNNRAENHSSAKLTNSQVREIRRLRKEKSLSTSQLSKMFNMNVSTINNIVYNPNRYKGV